MNRRRTALLAALASAIVLFLIQANLRLNTSGTHAPLAAVSTGAALHDEPKALRSEPSVQRSEPSAPPSISELRAEIARDPHHTPEALIRFSIEMGERMKLALENEQSATELLVSLKACMQEGVPEQAQSFCLSNAEELARKFPAKFDAYVELRDAASPRIRQLAKIVSDS